MALRWAFVGSRVLAYREENKLSQRGLAEVTGVSASTICRIERATCRVWGTTQKLYHNIGWDDTKLHQDLTGDDRVLQHRVEWLENIK